MVWLWIVGSWALDALVHKLLALRHAKLEAEREEQKSDENPAFSVDKGGRLMERLAHPPRMFR